MSRNHATPPAATSPADGRNVRCGCGFAYNGYRWGRCPNCTANEKDWFALGCYSCGNSYFHSERVEPCPRCGSGETTVVCSPDPTPDPHYPPR